MKLSENEERTLAEIETYNPGLAKALRKACSTAAKEGPSEKETAKQDAYFKAGDARVQAQQHGGNVGRGAVPANHSHEKSLRIIGLSESGYGRLVRDFGAGAVEEQIRIAVKDVGCGTKVNHAESFLLYRLNVDKGRGAA